MLRQLSRQLIFASRIPPRQMMRRAWLAGRRSVEARFKPSLPAGDVRPRAVSPPPLFEPRSGIAERVAGGWRFRFIGRAIDLPSPIDWRAPGPSGRDQLWRMNLHYMEYLEAVNDEEFGELVSGWIAANPPYDGEAMADAWNGYALSLRVVVWMQQLASRRQRLPPDLVARVERSLARQLVYLERHLETDIGGNHLIKNIKALIWGSAYFAGGRAQRWRRTATRLLRRQLSVQMLADGMHYERSPSYHGQVLADLLEIRHAAGADLLEGALDEALDAAAQVAEDLCHPDGLTAQFGDSGLHMTYPPAELASAFRRVTGRARHARARFSFPDAGYFGLRDGDSFLVIDAGDIAPPALPAHGHADIFSFEWSVDGQRIVVDQGVFEYSAGERRRRSRSASYHNTLELAGRDQADFYGSFRCGRLPKVTIRRFEPQRSGFVLEACHDGFRSLLGATRHCRTFIASPRRIRIEDGIEGPNRRSARSGLLLHPAAAVQQIAAGQLMISCGKARIKVTAGLPLAVQPAVWWPDMGVERATNRIIMEFPSGTTQAWLELDATPDEGAP